MKLYQIKDDIYHQHFTLITQISGADLKKYIDKKYPLGKLEVPENTVGCYFYVTREKDGLKYYFLWLPEFNWNIQTLSVLNHELIHHLTETFKEKNIPMINENSEALAYYFEYISTKVLRALIPEIKKKNICRTRKKK